MLRFTRVFFLLLPLVLVAGGSRCMAQEQTTVKVDDKDYTVTSLSRGRMFQITTPDGRTAMIMPTASAYNIISPPNGVYNGIDYKPQIAKIWKAYQDQKGGTTATTPTSVNDPNAARRQAQLDAANAQAAKAQAHAGGVNRTGGDEKPVFKAFTESGAIVTHPKFGDVTVSDNGMKYSWTINPVDPRTGEKGVPSIYTVSFEGGDTEAGAGAKTGKLLRGLGTGIGNGMNHNANAASSMTTKTDVWKEVEQHGSTKQLVFESGGMRVGGQIGYNGRDPVGNQGEADLNLVKGLWAVVSDEIAKAKATNQTVPFDPTTDRFKRGMDSLDQATAKFSSK